VLSAAVFAVPVGVLLGSPVSKPQAAHAVTTYSWANGDSTGNWNSTSGTTDWSSATYPNAAGIIAQGPTPSGGYGVVNLNVNVTVGELKPGQILGGAGWSITGTSNTITLDGTGLGTNDFGDSNVAEIRDASAAGTFNISTNLALTNTNLDLGWVNTTATTGMNIGVLGTTTILNNGSNPLAINIESNTKGGAASPSTTINSAIGTSGAGLTINDSSIGAGAVQLEGALGTSVINVNDTGTDRLIMSNTGNAFTGNLNIGSGANVTLAYGYKSYVTGQVIPIGAGTSVLIDNGTLELSGDSQGVDGITGNGLVTNTKWDGSIGGSAVTFTVGYNNASAVFGGTIQGASGRTIGLAKVGTGTQVFNNSGFSLTGNITVSGGTLQIGDGSNATASLGTNAIVDNANLAYDYNGAVSVSNAISGSGSVSQIGASPLTLTGGNSFSGGLNVSSSSVIAGSSSANVLGTGTVTLSANTTLDINGFSPTTGLLSSAASSALVTNRGASPSVLTLSASGVSSFAGSIQDGASNTIAITKAGSGTQRLAGINTYSGSTTINAGKLSLSGSLGNTAIMVNPGGTFAPLPGSASVSAGSTGTGSLGATLTLAAGTGSNPGGIFSMVDSATGVFNLNQQTSFSGTALTLGGAGSASNAPILLFDLGANSVDELAVNTGSVNIGSTGADVTIQPVAGVTSITPGSYTIISAPGGGLAPLTLTSSSFILGTQPYTLSLANSTSTAEILTVTAVNNIPLYAYYTGAAPTTSWAATSPTNFATDHTGSTPTSGAPGGGSNVFMTADGASSSTLSTTLDNAYNLNSLTFTGTGTTAATTSVTVAAGTGGSLTLTPSSSFNSTTGSGTVTYGPGIGIVVQPGSAAHTISAPIVLGSSQTWEIDNSAANPLTISGNISDNAMGFALNKTGTGTLILSGSNSFSGGTNISAGTLQTTAVGALPLNSVLTLNGGTLDIDGISQTVSTLSDGGVSTGSIINSGAAATFNINGSTGSTFSGSFNASASTLTMNGTGPVVLSGPLKLQYFNVYAGTTTLTATGSITSGTASDVNIGDNAFFNVTGGTINTAAFYTSSNGTSATIIGPGSNITVTGALALNNDNGSGGGGSYFQNSGGVINVGSITIGRTSYSGGNGTVLTAVPANNSLYLTAGTINDAGTLYLGTNHLTNSNANVRIDGGTFNVSGATIITCAGNTRFSTLDVNGGTFNGTTVQIGGNAGTAAGESGELLIRGTGVANVSGIIFGNSAQTTGTDLLNLLGGTLYVDAGGLVNDSTLTPTINLGGTTYATAPVLAASAAWSSSLLITSTNSSSGIAPIVQAANASGGAENITLSGLVEGAGGLTKTGAGTLYLSAANGYSGITNINAGILNINGQYALGGADYAGTTFNGGTLQFASGFAADNNGSGDISQNSTGTAKPVTFAAGGATIDLNGNPVTFADPLGNNGAGGLTLLDSAGGGSLTLQGSSSYAGHTNVASGTLVVASTGTLPNNTTLLINGAANLSNPTQTIASLSGTGSLSLNSTALKITAHTGTQTANTIGSLSLSGTTGSWTSSLDLTNNSLIIHGSSTPAVAAQLLATVTNQAQQGYNGGAWNGTGGIISSTAAANASHLTAVGVILNDNSGTALMSSFENAPTVDGDVLVKYTYYGDTNLDGVVDGSDYSRVDASYVAEGFNPATGLAANPISGWYNGDFNYDGVVDGSDYTLIDNAFNSQSTVYSAQIAAQVGGSSAVPEPATLSVIGIGAVGLLGRRRRSQQSR
jgi:autotransporter-associated beta strand protein